MEMESDEDLATCLGVLHRLAAADGTARPEYSESLSYWELQLHTLPLSHQPVLS